MAASFQELVDQVGGPWREACLAALAAAPSPEQAGSAFERLFESGGAAALQSWPVQDLGDLAVVLGGSPHFVRQLVSLGEAWPALAATMGQAMPAAADLARGCGLLVDDDTPTLFRKLRRMAAAEMFRIGARDLTGRADLHETVTALTQLAVEKLGPVGSEMQRLMKDPGHVDAILRDGAERARAIAAPILAEVYKTVGFLRP